MPTALKPMPGASLQNINKKIKQVWCQPGIPARFFKKGGKPEGNYDQIEIK
jgi:hypothetical protein